MTIQITVRLPDENVAWLDAEVAAGRFGSRTEGLAKLLTKAQRRQEDEADMLKILANPDPDDESRLEWMRTREYPPIDDDMHYDDNADPVPRNAVRESTGDNGIPVSARGRVRRDTAGRNIAKANRTADA
jgi:Arc/MetJ-type ribon-helix-helix transcriptional regulator